MKHQASFGVIQNNTALKHLNLTISKLISFGVIQNNTALKLDELSIEKIKAKKGNKIQRFVIRFKEYEDPNPVPMINFMTGEEI